jgi:hypothetical protein
MKKTRIQQLEAKKGKILKQNPYNPDGSAEGNGNQSTRKWEGMDLDEEHIDKFFSRDMKEKINQLRREEITVQPIGTINWNN